METLTLIALVGFLNVCCFIVGARVGQKVVNKEPIKVPNLNPVKAYEDYKESKEYREEQDKINTMLENINNYNGTGLGQKDIK